MYNAPGTSWKTGHVDRVYNIDSNVGLSGMLSPMFSLRDIRSDISHIFVLHSHILKPFSWVSVYLSTFQYSLFACFAHLMEEILKDCFCPSSHYYPLSTSPGHPNIHPSKANQSLYLVICIRSYPLVSSHSSRAFCFFFWILYHISLITCTFVYVYYIAIVLSKAPTR